MICYINAFISQSQVSLLLSLESPAEGANVVYLLTALADNASDCNSPNVRLVPTPINPSPNRVAIYAKVNTELFTYNNKRKEISDGCMVHGGSLS